MIWKLGLGFRPGFGQQPNPTPEPALVEQPSQPADVIPDYADRPRVPVARVAAPLGSRGPGRRPQPAGVDLPFLGILHSGAVGQGQQRRDGQHEPMAGDARRVRPPGLVPLPAQALDGPRIQYGAGFETQFDNVTPCLTRGQKRSPYQLTPTASSGWSVSMIQSSGWSAHQTTSRVQRRFGRAPESGTAANPRGIRLGNEGSGRAVADRPRHRR